MDREPKTWGFRSYKVSILIFLCSSFKGKKGTILSQVNEFVIFKSLYSTYTKLSSKWFHQHSSSQQLYMTQFPLVPFHIRRFIEATQMEML